MMLAVRRLVEPKQEADPASEVSQSDATPEQLVTSSLPADDGVSTSPSPRLRRANVPPPLTKPLPSGGSPTHTPPHTPPKGKPDSPSNTHTHTRPPSHTAHAGSPKRKAPPSSPGQKHPAAQKHTHATSESHTHIPTHTHTRTVPQLCLPEGEDSAVPPGGQRVTRSSSSVLDQASQVNRSQSQGFATATRPRRKSRPPTPPKRSCSSVSNSNLADEAAPANDTEAEAGLLSVSYRERRRSDCGVVTMETGVLSSAGGGSVRDIAAMLEMTSPLGGGCSYLQVHKPNEAFALSTSCDAYRMGCCC